MGQYDGLENKKILVVEDVELNQFLARHIMESWGCIVHIVENGALALEEIKKEDFDLVLMDIQMPVMDGMEATRQIRKLENAKKSAVPIVALTANARRDDFDIYLKVGMNDCMPKPFEEPALFKTVSKNILKNNDSFMSVSSESIVQAEAPAPFSKLYDLAMIETVSGGDKSFIGKMLQLFLDTAPVSLSEIRTATDKQDWQTVSKLAHKLKSTIDSMGIIEIKQTVREIERNGKTETDVALIPSLVKKVIEEMERVMLQIKKDHSL